MGAGSSTSGCEASAEQKQLTNQAEPPQSTPTVTHAQSKPTTVQVKPGSASAEQKQLTNQAEPPQSTPTVTHAQSKPTTVQVKPGGASAEQKQLTNQAEPPQSTPTVTHAQSKPTTVQVKPGSASAEQKQLTNQAEPPQSTPTVTHAQSKPTTLQVKPCSDNEVKSVTVEDKYWVGKNSKNCFMVYSKELFICWVEDHRYWKWVSLKETSNELIEVAELLNVCWLEVNGKFDATKLPPGTLYEVAFVIMLKDPAYGWEVPVNVKLVLPDGTKQESKVNLMEKVRGQWIKIPVGEFRTPLKKQGEIEFSMWEIVGGIWKKGLVVKGVTIQPKS